ncbi:MAG: hypothetical protein EOP54_21685, partial [Sphingobacteriales bacterium]
MDKLFLRILFFLTLATLFSAPVLAQTITIEDFTTGNYGPGSSITVRVNVSGACINSLTNKFRLFLSDASGSFANEEEIGSFTGFYTTFVNGRIPLTQATGTQYKLRVKADAAPAAIPPETAVFRIVSNPGALIRINTERLVSTNEEVFGNCAVAEDKTLTLTNSTGAGITVNATVFNELTNSFNTPVSFASSPDQPLAITTAHYTLKATATNAAGVISTRSYM